MQLTASKTFQQPKSSTIMHSARNKYEKHSLQTQDVQQSSPLSGTARADDQVMLDDFTMEKFFKHNEALKKD